MLNLNEAISSVILFESSSLSNSKINIDVDGDNVDIFSYPDLINRIFIKLTDNSIIHGFGDEKRGNISVLLKKNENSIEIKYFNDGKNIPEDIIDKVFDPFFTENKKKGAGLGLCIVYNLVVFTLNGNITCNNIDDGVCFTLTLPLND